MVNIDPEKLAASLRRLGHADDRDISAALNEAVAACVQLFAVSGSGLMIADQQNALRYAAASDGPGRVLEDVQSRTGQGPCVDTFVNGEIVTTDDLATETRWPASRDTIIEHGVRSVLGVPVHLGAVTVGSLDVYMDRPHHWDASERAALVRYGEVLETTLNAALTARHTSELVDQLQYALDYRVVIERAVGYLMAAHRADAVTAFDLLRRAARNQRRKVAEVAQHLLDTGSLP
ncbi:GAF and ANTAR domain-containing protein [Pseudonocardia adelaidensis]|uniref:GAF and ANTAR domain-containing protein n=1 Tax=Pseudonocardia adelaidensis TaxID=648754 RepID=A0ABP9NQI7_9PSEU